MTIVSQQAAEPSKGTYAAQQGQEPPAPSAVSPATLFCWKGIVDRVLAAILFIPILPVIGILCVLVRLTSPGPAIYRQARVGKGGKAFTMYKIRTMRQDAERRTGAVWTAQHDVRVTGLGRVLRRLHLDEFPQIVNVLRGEMSLVGPRPERPEFVAVLAKEISGYTDRLLVRPGVTGLAQINLPPDTDLESVRRKLFLDVQYIQSGHLLLDLRILLCTLLRVIGVPGTTAMRLLGLSRLVPGSPHSSTPTLSPPESATPLGIAREVRHAAGSGNGEAAARGPHRSGNRHRQQLAKPR